MKWTCKKCQKKYKGNSGKDVTCDDSQCDVKYDITSIELGFAGSNFKIDKNIEFEAVFESPEPVISVMDELTVEQWQAFLQAQVYKDGDVGPPF